MLRALAFLYGLVAYVAFLAVILYFVLFMGYYIMPQAWQERIYSQPIYTSPQGWSLRVTSVDAGQFVGVYDAVTIDLLLLAAFAVQHSLMARQGFKRVWTKIVPQPIERSTFVLASALVLALIFWQWRPIPEYLEHPTLSWNFTRETHPWVFKIFQVAYWVGFALVFLSTFVINHFDLFGLRQTWTYLRGREYQPLEFKERLFYRFVRHPLMLGFLIMLWAVPTMTLGRGLFSLGMTAYILVGILLEERGLAAAHGQAYLDYRRRTSMLLPLRWRRS
jgi:protein-S-isoprenylcysteine O-methyltransferase Ste14